MAIWNGMRWGWPFKKKQAISLDDIDDIDKPKKLRFSPRVKRQLWILSLCRFAEPVGLTSVFPYLYFMILSFNVPKEDIAFWVGVTASSFSFCQFASSIFWGRLSDRFGRKPTILIGLFGTMVSSIFFGFARNLPSAIFARCMAGLLNGNVGIMRTLVAEIVPERELQPQAFALMPLVWSMGSIFGPIIGGYLSDPVKNYPDIFPPGGWLEKYPYALPNLFNAALFLLGVVIGFLYLEESLETLRNERDIGCELGKKLNDLVRRRGRPADAKDSEGGYVGEIGQIVITDEESSEYDDDSELDERRQLLTAPGARDEEEQGDHLPNTPPGTPPNRSAGPPPLRDAFTPQSTLNIVVYSFLALQSVGYDQLLPVYMSYPTLVRYNDHILHFFGGFNLNSVEIGRIYSILGIGAMVMQFFVFAPTIRRLGALRALKFCFIIFPLVYILSPFAVILPQPWDQVLLYTLMAAKSLVSVFAFPATTILLTNSAPSMALLGSLNGVATAFAALGRSLGPTICGYVFGVGQRLGVLVLPWWGLAFMAIAGAVPVVLLREMAGPGLGELKRPDLVQEDDEEEEEEDAAK